MDFAITPRMRELQAATREFIARKVVPYENDPRQTEHGPTEDLRRELVALARQANLLTPHASVEMGGLGLSHREKAVLFEEAGYSPLGPTALNIHAPDEGNIHMLEVVANDEQKERWLRPLVRGEIRSCFCMTEPPPGAGSDPGLLRTTAQPVDDGYVINGEKLYITGATGAKLAIIMARMPDGAATMFLADMERDEIRIEKQLTALDTCFTGGHAHVRIDNLRVAKNDVLGEPGRGFHYAQVRLAPARLTHCMRWLGQARRAHDVAVEYSREREAFGKPIGQHEGVSFMLADNLMDLHAARLAIWHTAWVLDQGRDGGLESSLTKVMASEAQWRVVDRSVQILGGSGVTDRTIVARIFRDMRAFRIYDGPSEVHRWSIGKRIAKGTV